MPQALNHFRVIFKSRKGQGRIPVILSLALGSGLLGNLHAFAATPTAAELTKILDSSGVLQKGYKCRVILEKSACTVFSYQNMQSKNKENDCKIDAVLLAKKVFDAAPGLARVKVKLLDPRGTGACKNVTITLGDITAFSSGKVNMQSLMNSLEIVDSQEGPDPTKNANAKVGGSKSSLRMTSNNLQVLSPLAKIPLVFTIEKRANVRLAYPKGWSMTESPAKDTLVSFGDQEGNSIAFNAESKPRELSLPDYVQTIDNLAPTKLKDFQVLETYPVRFGGTQNLNGIAQEIKFTADQERLKGTFYYFTDNLKFFMLRFVGLENNIENLKRIRGDIMHYTNIIPRAQSSQTAALTGRDTSKGKDCYINPEANLSFRFPPNWTVQLDPDPSCDVSISGLNRNGQGGEMRFAARYPGEEKTLEQFLIDALDVTQKTTKNFKRSEISHDNIGANHSFQALRASCSFELDGITITQQQVVFKKDGRFCWLSLTTPGWTQQESKYFVDGILASMEAAN
ncbi:MAG: DUF1795 domain-containing protein [Candidatus Obscuribacterales bacterium]|nr:DUF1795 domain-containing protein [Candidatus Obscuribacterales bacterium]